MKSKIVILEDSVILYSNYIGNDSWERVDAFPRGGLTYLLKNNNIKFFAYHDWLYKNCIISMELPLYIIDEELGIDGEYSDVEEITEILNRIFPSNTAGGEIDLTSYLKKREAAELYQPIGDYLTKESGDTLYQPIGDYVTDDELETILEDYYTKDEVDDLLGNKQDKLSAGTGIEISGNVISCTVTGGSGTTDAYTKAESDERFQPKGDYLSGNALNGYATEQWVENKGYINELKTINGESLIGQGNIVISGGSGTSITVDSELSLISTNPVENKVITEALNSKLDASGLTGYATEQWVESKGYITGVDLSNYATLQDIPTVPTDVSAFNNDAGYITSSSTVFNNYYNKTEIDNLINYINGQISGLVDSYSECCTAMTLEGTAIYWTSSAGQNIDIGSSSQIAIIRRPNGTIITPAADQNQVYPMPNNGQNKCTFRLIEGITYLGCCGNQSLFTSQNVLKWSFNGGFSKIDEFCFSGSTRLQVIELPSTVTEIGYCAFSGNTAMTNITIHATTPPTLPTSGIYANALDDLYAVNQNFTIYVPADAVNSYKSASGWSTYSAKIQAIP